MKKLLIFCALFLIICRAYSQDSLTLFFKNEKVLFSDIHGKIALITNDSLFSETLLDVGGDKFLYLKRSISDALPVELGQLGMYLIDNKAYLFREGLWVVEWSKEKVLFANSGKEGLFLDEYPISLESVMMYNSGKKIKKRKKTGSAVTLYQ